jgi:hypothetical protein
MTAEQLTDRQAEGLRRDAVGLPDVIFTSVTTMAPAAGAAFSITVGALFAGGALSAGVVIALAGFALVGTIITGAILPIYIAVNIACIAYFWRERRPEFNVLKHLVVPVLGIALFVPGFFTGLGIPVFNFISKLSYPLSLAGPIIIGWYAIGIVLVIYFSVRHPERIRDTAKVFIQLDAPELSKPSPT